LHSEILTYSALLLFTAIVYPKVSQALKIAEAVESKLLPSLLSYLEQKDDTEDSIRIPIALGIVKVALNLPESSREAQIGRLLTILSQVFRSKSQETRDLAKDTMIKIAVTLGPEWLAQIVREMKGALQRGPQLHVLAFTIHAILVHVTSLAQSEFSDLDDCVTDVVNIASEVIFGESGKDLQAEGFKTKMREVRTSTSKGLDTFQLVARLVSPPKMSQLLLPIREILQTTEVLKVLQQVDDVLRRCASGLNSNERLNPSELLVLCHTLVGQNANFLKPKAKSTKLEGGRAKKSFHVDTKRSVAKDVDHYAANAHKFVSFGLDLFITAFRRGRFDFADQAILARLDPLVNIIGNTLYAGDSQVVVLGLKSTAALVKCPLETITTSMPVFIQQIFAIMKQEGGTESDVAQTALKTLAVILRDRKDVEIKEKQLGYLLEIISPDIEDPSRQTTLFGLLRAIISRKFVVADIYDLMERVSEIMVTSQSANVQELCRISVMQFLLDYPQGRGRLKKQMQFLAKNLSYVYESGRISVMEILSAIFSKFSVELVREYSDLFFVALVMVIANDESAKCREMAAELIKNLLPRLDEDLLSKTVAILHTWASQTSQPQLPRLASQVFGLVIDCLAANSRPFAAITLVDLQSILSHSATSLEAYETVQEEPSPFDMETDEDLDWQLPYQTLTSLAKLLRAFPDLIPSIEWKPIIGHLLFPHAWVRLAASRLVGTLFGSTPPSFDLSHTSPSDGGPLQPRGLFDLTRKSLLQLKGESIDEALAMQIVKNVVYLGRCFAAGPSDPGSFVTPVPEVVEEVAEEEMQEDQMGGEEEEQEEIEQEEEKPPVDEDEQGSEEEALQRALANPLAWLFTKLSQLARSILISRPPSHGDPSVSFFPSWIPFSPFLLLIGIANALICIFSFPSASTNPSHPFYLPTLCRPFIHP
jgi:U3 small nucleolar RNA-associated protein 20